MDIKKRAPRRNSRTKPLETLGLFLLVAAVLLFVFADEDWLLNLWPQSETSETQRNSSEVMARAVIEEKLEDLIDESEVRIERLDELAFELEKSKKSIQAEKSEYQKIQKKIITLRDFLQADRKSASLTKAPTFVGQSIETLNQKLKLQGLSPIEIKQHNFNNRSYLRSHFPQTFRKNDIYFRSEALGAVRSLAQTLESEGISEILVTGIYNGASSGGVSELTKERAGVYKNYLQEILSPETQVLTQYVEDTAMSQEGVEIWVETQFQAENLGTKK